ncbi:hypothetical protein, partial [Microcoleus sp. herbarium13]|uniref:hypothetical protein n=1 Tax=Microcoleus sp. herbarium13 TaxID=3055438 RepID=UPI002FD124D5
MGRFITNSLDLRLGSCGDRNNCFFASGSLILPAQIRLSCCAFKLNAKTVWVHLYLARAKHFGRQFIS